MSSELRASDLAEVYESERTCIILILLLIFTTSDSPIRVSCWILQVISINVD